MTALLETFSLFSLLLKNQEVKPMSSNSSPNHSHSPEVSSRITDDETQEAETAKSLNEKLVLATGSDGSPSPQLKANPDQEIGQPEACKALELEPEACQLPQQDVSQNFVVVDSVKSLNEKLSAALWTISAKEDLVKQHTKVAEEAVAGNFLFPVGVHEYCRLSYSTDGGTQYAFLFFTISCACDKSA
jgi:hypothetical protein